MAAYQRLAHARSRVVLASFEVALGIEERTNEPGTTTERPNWRLALTKPLEEIEHDEGVLRIAQSMRDARR